MHIPSLCPMPTHSHTTTTTTTNRHSSLEYHASKYRRASKHHLASVFYWSSPPKTLSNLIGTPTPTTFTHDILLKTRNRTLNFLHTLRIPIIPPLSPLFLWFFLSCIAYRWPKPSNSPLNYLDSTPFYLSLVYFAGDQSPSHFFTLYSASRCGINEAGWSLYPLAIYERRVDTNLPTTTNSLTEHTLTLQFFLEYICAIAHSIPSYRHDNKLRYASTKINGLY